MSFIGEDFLLGNEQARQLYHEFAAACPIIDFHNHLSPAWIAEDRKFSDLQEAWLGGDHYKWRAMRSNGIAERLITGDALPREKFDAWAATVPYTLRNPLYHWTHLELVRYFGIGELLDQKSAGRIWEEANGFLRSMTVRDMASRFGVEVLCTTDDPAESLEDHEKIAQSGATFRVFPTYRPDKALRVDDPSGFRTWIDKLAATCGREIRTLADLLVALKQRHDAFDALGCRLSDHGLIASPSAPASLTGAAAVFSRCLEGRTASPQEQAEYASVVMHEVGRWNAARGWTMQLHLGALRNANARVMELLGPDAGCDSIGDGPQADALASFLGALDARGELPRTILYNLNPADNYVFGTMIGNFQDGSVPGKIQLGSGWWFLDQKEGMEWQLNALSNLGLLRRFVGMVTDSRSFLSFPRHEYFRRVLCNLLGRDMASGSLPDDLALVGAMVNEICHGNAREYFRFPR